MCKIINAYMYFVNLNVMGGGKTDINNYRY
jgi:hypothetical protein